MVANVEVCVNKYHNLLLQEVANQFSIGKASVHKILDENVGMSKVNSGWVPKQLTENQKTSKVTIVKEHSGRFNHDRNRFSNSIVNRDEMWVHYTESETKV